MWKRQAVRVGGTFLRHVVPAVVKPAMSLWNQVIGFIFIVLGVIFGSHAVRYALAGEYERLFVAGACTLIMAWFGIGSFLRARRISRS